MENNRENIKEKYKYYKDPKDVCIGIIFIFIGFFFFVIMSFWIIFYVFPEYPFHALKIIYPYVR